MNCATLGLEAYVPSAEQPWDVGRVQHLFRRVGFGATREEIEQALLDGPALAVSTLLNDAVTREQRAPPEWANWDYDAFEEADINNFDAYISWYLGFVEDSIQYGVREKLSLFWQNHFVTQYESHSCASYQYKYAKVIEDHTFGDFKQMVEDLTITPAMLFFLNGFENTRDNPNENFARELFELFTLGENNGYTQEDIVEASRALTGWNGWTSYCGGVDWADWGYDDSDKTVFGVTGNFNYTSLITTLFEQRGALIAYYICEKLYKFYVNKAVSEEVVEEMAQTFIAGGFQIMPVLQQLFASAHFFEEVNIGVLIKSPMDLTTSFLRQGGFGDFEDRLTWSFWGMANMGQYLGQAPDVAGWKGDRAWIDSNRLTLRWGIVDGFSWGIHNNSESTLTGFAKELTGDSNSPEIIARAIVDYFIPRGLLTEAAYNNAIDALKWEIPSNYYDTGEWNLNWDSASWQVVILLRHIGRLPEFQLT